MENINHNEKAIFVTCVVFVLGIQTSYSGGSIPPAPEGVDCVQPTIDGCEWSPNIFRDLDIDVDNDDAVAPVRIIDPGIGVLLSGKHLYNPAKGKPSGGPGKNPKRNGINETSVANCVPDFFGMPAN